MIPGFVFLNENVPNLRWDAKYASPDNFTGAPVDGYRANRVVGTLELADALSRVSALAGAKGLGLFVWDAYRPLRASERFVAWAKEPEDFRTKADHYPNVDRADMLTLGYIAAGRSSHSRGSTVDLTLYRLDTGDLLDMGGGFDLMDVRSHHGAQGISEQAAQNRALLRGMMLECGFADYECEWWHYRLKNEPYTTEYFDEPIE